VKKNTIHDEMEEQEQEVAKLEVAITMRRTRRLLE
jgi:hypothetical protein